MQTLTTDACPFPLTRAMVKHLNAVLAKHPQASSVVINYRNPDYSADTGGYHPVEIAIQQGCIQYIIDFTYYGRGDMAELGKELYFDFGLQRFGFISQDYPLEEGRAAFKVWQCNFTGFLKDEVFEITVSDQSTV